MRVSKFITKLIVTQFGICMLVLLLGWTLGFAQAYQVPPGVDHSTGPKPGEVFKDFPFIMNCWSFHPEKNFTAKIDDLKDAIRAEMAVENWGGHVGTSEQRIVINNNANSPVYYPLPKNTPTRPECYHRTMYGNAATEFPLSLLKEGENQIMFLHGKQICHGWNWPQTLTYGLNFRIYYKNTKPHPTGVITSPTPGSTIGKSVKLIASAESQNSTVRMVHFIGEYLDFDYEGNNEFHQWHFTYMRGKLARTLGRATSNPYTVTWGTSKYPDQLKPMRIAAIITDKNGYRYVTPAVENLTFKRDIRVTMFKPLSIPENFSVRDGAKKSCIIKLTEDITKASSVKLILSTWSAKPMHEGKVEEPGTTIFLNGKKLLNQFGSFHTPSLNSFDVPLDFFTKGVNVCNFAVHSDTKEHACEINIPGPVLMATFNEATNVRSPSALQTSSGLSLQASAKSFTYQVGMSGPFEFAITDASGRTLKKVSGVGPVGRSEIHVPNKQATGVYFGRLASGNQVKVKKIISILP